MKYTTSLFILLLSFSLQILAQKNMQPEKFYYKDISQEAGPVTIYITDGVATPAYIKYKLRVKNNTSGYILVSTDQIVLKVNGTEFRNIEKDFLIGPNDDESKVIDIKGTEFRVSEFSLELKGFSKIPESQGAVKAENFKLPIVKNDFKAGPFKLTQLKSVKKTDNVTVKFSVEYNGDKVGIVNPGLVSMRTPKETEFANMAAKWQRRPILLKKGQSDTFIVTWRDIPVSNGDMQFADINILWHECFSESTPEIFSVPEMNMSLDQGLTDGKNKR